ncbi:MAG: aminoacyl-tRNA hydrolase [Alphaproteobacteria bacterium GM7ARS4]|nr:aminoacyl-tRNA hydrolase [Alphaproteobacteria bacterium GM7ARS4]
MAQALLVGLGNPGQPFEQSRHNVGFMALDAIIGHYGCSSLCLKKRFHSLWSEGVLDGVSCVLMKPQTYMNRSGMAVLSVMKYFSFSMDNVFVFHDDMDLGFLRVKVKRGGSDGGHRGIRSIDTHSHGLSKEGELGGRGRVGGAYWRVRIGVGRPVADARHHVLGSFSGEERARLYALLALMAEHCPLMLRGDTSHFMEHMREGAET